MKKNLLKIFFAVLVIFSFTNTTQAQTFNLYSADDIFLEIIPEIPGPNEPVDLRLKSYSFNLNNYYIAWFLDGEKQSADYGNRNFHFTTGETGTVRNVTAVIEVAGQVFRKELRFAPSEVDLMWEVIDAYTPPFYRGKATPIKQSKIRVTAIPETQLIAPSDAAKLVYYWDKNYKRQIAQSGFGKNSLTFEADPLKWEEKIKVTVNDRRENSFAENILVLPTKEESPTILFYEINNKGRLMTNKALNNNGTINGDTVRLSFHPLNMSTIKPNFIDTFLKWIINGETKPPQDFEKQNELHITSNGESGEVSVGVEIEGVEKLLQKGKSNINILFN